MPRLVACLLAAALIASCASTGAVRRTQDLRVTRAVLYQNGIGYIERRGRVHDDMLKLYVRPDQIRDVLKSLTVVDLGSGRPVSIALPIEKSRAKQMADLPEQVRTQGGVLAIAQAFRGARCRVEADRTAVGRLVGVENLGGSGNAQASAPDWRVSVLTDEGGLQQLKVPEIESLTILEGTLEVGLRKALDTALDAGSWKPVELAIRLAGDSPHDLVVSYVVEMPTWKPAYRLVVNEKNRALLQGWAVVDNVSGDDWKDVNLSLTAGTPLAFTYDLYTPRFPRRPNLTARDDIAQVPLDAFQAQTGFTAAEPEAEMSLADSDDAYGAPPAAASKGMGMGSTAPRAMRKDRAAESKKMARSAPPPVSSELLQQSYKSLVAGATVGSLFRYDLEEPVTIDERQSALVNIVNAKVEGEQVLLFRVGSDAVSPYRAVRFKNDSGFVLEAGPIAIYQGDQAGGTFLGEAMAGRIEKTAMSFVPFAQDGRVRLTLAEEQREQGMTLAKLNRGVITAEAKSVTRYSYDVDNGSGEEVTLYVRRDRRPGWNLMADGRKLIEEGGAYYLPIPLAKTGRTKVTVEEQSPVVRTVDIWSDLGRDVLALYLSNGSADAKVAAQLKEVLKLREKVGQLSAQIETYTQQRDTQSQRQQEVRENIRVLGKASSNADLKRKLERTLGDLETALNEVTNKVVSLSMERSEARDRLSAMMGSISL